MRHIEYFLAFLPAGYFSAAYAQDVGGQAIARDGVATEPKHTRAVPALPCANCGRRSSATDDPISVTETPGHNRLRRGE